MKYIISHNQYKLLMEQEEDVLEVPYEIFNKDWNLLQKYLEKRNYPPYKIVGNVNLQGSNITDLGNLISVGGNLDLQRSSIENLGNLISVDGSLFLYYTHIKSLGNLTSVGNDLNLWQSKIKNLGNLTFVGGDLYSYNSPISKTMSEKKIRQVVNVLGNVYS